MTFADLTELARSMARPFTQYVVTVAFAAGMFMKLDIEVLGLAASLLAWHGYLRTQDKKSGSVVVSGGGASAMDVAAPLPSSGD